MPGRDVGLLTAVPFLVGATWRLPDTYHSAGFRRGTATLKFYEDRDISQALPRQDYRGSMLDLSRRDLDEIATALADQTDYEHRWLIDPRTGEIVFWTADR